MSTREANRIKQANWRAANPEKAKRAYKVADFRKTFGLELEDYEQLLVTQNGVCAVCGNTETALSNKGSVRRLCVDHCHGTGKIRGLLCYRCNYVLGLCKDNTAVLRGLATYVETADTGRKVPLVLTAEDVASMEEELRSL